MHRFNINLTTPTRMWDRNIPENVLFMNVWTKQNISENEDIFSMLNCESEKSIALCNALTIEQLKTVLEFIRENGEKITQSELLILQNIILRAPKESVTLRIALKTRGRWNFHQCRFEAAVNDLSMFMHINKNDDCSEEMCEVSGMLTVACYLMRDYNRTIIYLRSYNLYKDKLSRVCFMGGTSLEKLSTHINKFENEMKYLESAIPRSLDCMSFERPFKGFNVNINIRCSSAACSYIDDGNEDSKDSFSGIYANSDIPEGSTILIEKPLSYTRGLSLVQCELCLLHVDQVFSCLNCRYKIYCSLACMEKDKDRHSFECAGYKSLLIFILDAKDLFDLILSVSLFLDEHIFKHKQIRKLTSAASVLSKIEKHPGTNTIKNPYLSFLRIKPNYYDLTEAQYCTVVVTAFRMTLFIEKSTNIINRFYKELRLSPIQKSILVGSLLMRAHAYLLLNTLDFEYNYLINEVKAPLLKINDQLADSVIQPVCGMKRAKTYYRNSEAEVLVLSKRYFQLELKEEQFEREDTLSDSRAICRPLCVFKDKIATMYRSKQGIVNHLYGNGANTVTAEEVSRFLCFRVSSLNEGERLAFARSFVQDFHIHFFEYFHTLTHQPEGVQQVISLLCPNLKKFVHSCTPNVAIRLLENGYVVGTAVRQIEEGEELTVSYKVNSARHTRPQRKSFLKLYNIDCRCRACEGPETKEPTNMRRGIYCQKCCFFEMYPTLNFCSNCSADYRTMNTKYQMELIAMEHEISKKKKDLINGDRKIYILYMLSYFRVKRFFIPCNEGRIRLELQLARFYAVKNFAWDAYKILKETKAMLIKDYDEKSLWFTFYSDMLSIVMIIMHNNLDKRLFSIPWIILEELWRYAVYIINGQKTHISTYKTRYKDTAAVLGNLHQFLKWQAKHYTILMDTCFNITVNQPATSPIIIPDWEMIKTLISP